MTIIFIRVFFVFLSTLVGYQVGMILVPLNPFWPPATAAIGFLVALIIILAEFSMRKISLSGLSAGVFGLIFGLLMAKLITDSFVLTSIDQMHETVSMVMRVVLTLIFCYFGMTLAIRGKDEFSLIIPYVKFSRQDRRDDITVLDTSVIIDGRIADLCDTKFIGGKFIVPRFVLRELQQVADSSDSLKRNRGRRGLDILNKMQKSPNMDVKIHEEDFPELSDVDTKLVKLGKLLDARIFTNDYNLNKIAELQGVIVLNINELTNALKPIMLPGEELEVKVIKEGKEHSQGIGYLDDGTMIVVEGGRHLIGQRKKVVVTSVLQTAAGRMIFAKTDNDNQPKPKR
ncbi:MAG: TRAM domain-containing protein [Candidatus Omnitrophica bacterium]|nr:TRAM domain-containing protein [Candidatus Omnitrophota bacterium]